MRLIYFFTTDELCIELREVDMHGMPHVISSLCISLEELSEKLEELHMKKVKERIDKQLAK